jgi:hypothetical protein
MRILIVLLLGAFGLAHAEDRPWEALYSEQALMQQLENEELKCGFRDARWNRSEHEHRKWALDTTREIADGETEVRAAGLRACRRARDYAKQALEAQILNDEYRCRFSGGRWHSDFNSHFHWALWKSEYELAMESQERFRALEVCKAD